MPKPTNQLSLFIPTRGRVDKQITAKCLELDSLGVVYVVPQCEASLWKKPCLIVPDDYKFSDIRQAILNYPGDYHLVMDDDLRFSIRRQDDPTKFVNIETMDDEDRLGHAYAIVNEVTSLLDKGWVHGGMAARQGANRNTDQYLSVTREMRFHFYNAPFIRQLGYDFRRVTIKQDLDFTLWMLRQGFPNILINQYVQDQDGNNKDGGCSRYRTDEVLTEGAYKLASLHPEFVKVVEKKPKTAWGGVPRIDVDIQWKKAYKEGLRDAEAD